MIGFAKVTRDLTARHAADAALLTAKAAEQANLRGVALDVLDVARAEGEEMMITGAAGSFGEVLETALTLVQPQAEERKVRIIDEVSHSAAGLSYWGDEARVRQILVNLLSNAVKFTESHHGGESTVTITAGGATQPPAGMTLPGKGPWMYVRFQDTGPGIPAAKLESIFEPYVQVGRSAKERERGTGLGLAISRQLARRMCGDISVDTTEGVGSTFVLWLPVAAVESVSTGGT